MERENKKDAVAALHRERIMAAASGEAIKSAFDYPELEQRLEKLHFFICQHLSRAENQQRYFANRTDWLTSFEHIPYVLSVLN